MAISPEEIRSKDFLVALRGYDKDEVAAFLRLVADEHAEMVERLAQVDHQALGGDRRPADAFAGLGDKVEVVLRTAADAAAQLRAQSEKEAGEVRAAAVRESQRVIEAAQAELETAHGLRGEAEQEAAYIRAEAREEVARLRDEARTELEAARQARMLAARNVAQLAASASRREEALVAETQRRLALALSAAEAEVEHALTDVLQGCARLRSVEARALMNLDTTAPDDAADAGGHEAGERQAQNGAFGAEVEPVAETPT